MFDELIFRPIDLFFLWYFLSVNAVYMFLIVLGMGRIFLRLGELSQDDPNYILYSETLPEITFLIPAYNESQHVISSINSLLHLTYRYKQVIVINDGSTDETLLILQKELNLISMPIYFEEKIKTQSIRAVYRSKKCPEVIVIDKDHGGKWDTLNVGINACLNPLFIAIDADTVIDDPGFETLIRPLLVSSETIAVGASVRLKNACTLDFNRISTVKFPQNPLEAFQIFEYLRSFLMRQGWDIFGGNFVISGCFSIFPTKLIQSAGGLSSSVAEDMEIIVRLHHLMKGKYAPYKMFNLADPIAWTEGPSTLKSLGKQRTRWHLGLLETLWYHKKMCLNPRYGLFGLFVYPFWILGEAFEPVIEVLGYIVIIGSWILGTINSSFFLLLVLVSLGFTFLFSITCILIEEISFKKYPSMKSIATLILLCLLENLGYRQLTIYWRLKAFVQFFKTFKKIHKESRIINKIIKTAK